MGKSESKELTVVALSHQELARQLDEECMCGGMADDDVEFECASAAKLIAAHCAAREASLLEALKNIANVQVDWKSEKDIQEAFLDCIYQAQHALCNHSGAPLMEALKVVSKQAEDEALWFINGTASEQYLQNALRELHEVIERKTRLECAQAAIANCEKPIGATVKNSLTVHQPQSNMAPTTKQERDDLLEALHFALKTMVNHGYGYECDFCDVVMDDHDFIDHKEDCPIEKLDAAITKYEEAAG